MPEQNLNAMPAPNMTAPMPVSQGPSNHSPKYAFLYLLSFCTLHIVAIAVGTIFFSLIDKYLGDKGYGRYFYSSGVKFSISALIVAAPVYYLTVRWIRNGLIKGEIGLHSGLRRWLTYLLLFDASCTIIGCLIGVVNQFISGGITATFGLQMLTVIVIAGLLLGYYAHDISLQQIAPRDSFVMSFFAVSLLLIVVSMVMAFVVIGSPMDNKKRQNDERVVSKISTVMSYINSYADQHNRLPDKLDDLTTSGATFGTVSADSLLNETTKKKFEYRITASENTSATYELCTDFQTSNLTDESGAYYYNQLKHDKGRVCFSKNVTLDYNPPVYYNGSGAYPLPE